MPKEFKHFSQYSYIPLICLAFTVVYIFSLSFVYVEGDDASILTYHLTGRDNTLRPRYAIYQAMFDMILSFFPSKEALLKIFSIALSALSACIFTILAMDVSFNLRVVKKKEKLFYAFIFLILSPELFFSGLYINPTIIACVFILASHKLLLNNKKEGTANFLRLFISSLLFGFGVSIRWTTAVYALTIFLDLLIMDRHVDREPGIDPRKLRFLRVFVWTIFSLCFTVIFISISLKDDFRLLSSSYLLKEIIEFLQSENTRFFSLISIARMVSLLSPLLILVSFFGLYGLFQKKMWKFLIISISQLLVILFFFKAGLVKNVIVIMPIIWMLFIAGIEVIKNKVNYKKVRDLITYLFLIFCFIPWGMGIKITSSSTLWGPGFEIRMPQAYADLPQDTKIRYSPEISFTFQDFKPVLDAGFALASPEGPRPLGGYAHVLLGGQWRSFVMVVDRDIDQILDKGKVADVILQIGGGKDSRLVNKLIASGYVNFSVNQHNENNNKKIPAINMTNKFGDSITIYHVYDSDILLENDFCNHHEALCKKPVPFFTNYTSILSLLLNKFSEEKFEILSPFSGVLSLGLSSGN